ncbi:hypothetical protein BDQ94DRAFT_140242 [Aspergillus welwitschiae]|uniref:Uncharacterized protein n=1 Tax=Aspergillus welwitschiae TaxID=1341132 RepID=A0A3F3Q8Q2_9EURO|nr:hypothetical protein BDQ94DRAFT_140242 [Aspergillus welwitschiae]RDH35116.1 hypothetical protein BDQ94DRAFT_140242 [Aspergillus welwitschiae]
MLANIRPLLLISFSYSCSKRNRGYLFTCGGLLSQEPTRYIYIYICIIIRFLSVYQESEAI